MKALYERLKEAFPGRGWWPAKSKSEIIAGAILTQNTNWRNVEKSLDNLRPVTHFEPGAIRALSPEDLQELIRPSGFYKQKAKGLQGFFQWSGQYDDNWTKIDAHFGDRLRKELLSLQSVGQETADVLLLYIFERVTFVADAYARRLFRKLGVTIEPDAYQTLKPRVSLEGFTVDEAKLFHGLIDDFGKMYLGRTDTFSDSFLAGDTIDLQK